MENFSHSLFRSSTIGSSKEQRMVLQHMAPSAFTDLKEAESHIKTAEEYLKSPKELSTEAQTQVQATLSRLGASTKAEFTESLNKLRALHEERTKATNEFTTLKTNNEKTLTSVKNEINALSKTESANKAISEAYKLIAEFSDATNLKSKLYTRDASVNELMKYIGDLIDAAKIDKPKEEVTKKEIGVYETKQTNFETNTLSTIIGKYNEVKASKLTSATTAAANNIRDEVEKRKLAIWADIKVAAEGNSAGKKTLIEYLQKQLEATHKILTDHSLEFPDTKKSTDSNPSTKPEATKIPEDLVKKITDPKATDLTAADKEALEKMPFGKLFTMLLEVFKGIFKLLEENKTQNGQTAKSIEELKKQQQDWALQIAQLQGIPGQYPPGGFRQPYGVGPTPNLYRPMGALPPGMDKGQQIRYCETQRNRCGQAIDRCQCLNGALRPYGAQVDDRGILCSNPQYIPAVTRIFGQNGMECTNPQVLRHLPPNCAVRYVIDNCADMKNYRVVVVNISGSNNTVNVGGNLAVAQNGKPRVATARPQTAEPPVAPPPLEMPKATIPIETLPVPSILLPKPPGDMGPPPIDIRPTPPASSIPSSIGA